MEITQPTALFYFIFLLFNWVYWVTLVNKITLVSGTQFHNTPSVHCTVCSHPKSISFHHHLPILEVEELRPRKRRGVSFPGLLCSQRKMMLWAWWWWNEALGPTLSHSSCRKSRCNSWRPSSLLLTTEPLRMESHVRKGATKEDTKVCDSEKDGPPHLPLSTYFYRFPSCLMFHKAFLLNAAEPIWTMHNQPSNEWGEILKK